MDNAFLVQLSEKPTFLTSVRDGTVFESPYPTHAKQMSFDAANSLAQRLRDAGFEVASVVDRFGQPPTATDLATVKRSVMYQVLFSGHYFTGQNVSSRDLGNRDRTKAVSMSQAAARAVVQRLKRAGHLDATVIEATAPTEDVNEELKQIWPEEFSKK